MRMTRLLFAVLVAVASSLPMVAQSAVGRPNGRLNFAQAAQATRDAPRDNVLRVPGMAKQDLTPQVAKIDVPPVDMSKGLVNKSQWVPQNDGCFTLRSYGFTEDDLKSDAPRPSTSTTCTPASTGKTKQANAAILVR